MCIGLFPITFAKIRHLAGAICTLWSKMVHFRPFWFILVQDGTLSPLSYMMIACVIYDDRLRHIWYSPASYMILASVIYDALSCHVECRLMPDMPPASTLYADIWNHLSWCCYTLGEWVIFMLLSRRETATISANGGGWSYTLSERWNAKYLIIR